MLCISRVFLTRLRFYIGFTRSKNSYNAILCSAFGCKYDSTRYRELFSSISSGKTDSSEAMNSQLRAGWLKSHVLKFNKI